MNFLKKTISFSYIIYAFIAGLIFQTLIYSIWFFLWIFKNLNSGTILLGNTLVATVIKKEDTFSVDVNPLSAFYIWILCSVLIYFFIILFKKNKNKN